MARGTWQRAQSAEPRSRTPLIPIWEQHTGPKSVVVADQCQWFLCCGWFESFGLWRSFLNTLDGRNWYTSIWHFLVYRTLKAQHLPYLSIHTFSQRLPFKVALPFKTHCVIWHSQPPGAIWGSVSRTLQHVDRDGDQTTNALIGRQAAQPPDSWPPLSNNMNAKTQGYMINANCFTCQWFVMFWLIVVCCRKLLNTVCCHWTFCKYIQYLNVCNLRERCMRNVSPLCSGCVMFPYKCSRCYKLGERYKPDS